jgi:hypothetical protein
MSNTYFKAMSVMGCEIGGIARRSLCCHNCCDGENCVTWLEKQFAKLNEYEEGLKKLRSSFQWLSESIRDLGYRAWAEDNIGKIDALLGVAKEIILSEQKEPCDFCKYVYTIEATSYTYTEPIASLSGLSEINYCPKCGRPLSEEA